MGRQGMERRGCWGQERPTLRVESEGKSCPRPARGAARVARRRRRRREAAVAGRSRVRAGPPLGLAAGSPTPPGAPRPAARGLRRSPPCAPWARPGTETFTGESEPATGGEDAGSTRPARGDARPHGPEPRSPGAGSPPPARVRGALSRPGPGALASVPPAAGPQRLTNNKQK